MARLAIVSSYDESCGNATYAHVLKKAFSEHLEVDVLPLDLFLLQKKSRYFRKAGDAHIREIADRLKAYDYVNIQCEVGLYGSTFWSIVRRLETLINASSNLIFTMHRLDIPVASIGQVLAQSINQLSFRTCFDGLYHWGEAYLYRMLIDICRKRSGRINLWIATHTPRERRIVEKIYKFKNVFDFPITFLLPEERRALLDSRDDKRFRERHQIPPDVKVVGAFGFLGHYKGYQTLIAALRLLPKEYMLFIFGGQHPQTVQKDLEIDPSVEEIIDAIDEQTDLEIRRRGQRLKALSKSPPSASVTDEFMTYDQMDRVRFMGNIADPEFLEALRFSDAVVLPYLEVGQSMSGIVALALDCGANIFCSNNNSFAEVRKYYGDVFHTFDIGNHVELAQKIQFAKGDFMEARENAFARYNLRNNVKAHLDKFMGR